MSEIEENDSDAPEELTVEQGFHQDEEIRKIQKHNKARVMREGKERRRLWAQRKTPQPSKKPKDDQEVVEIETTEEDANESPERRGMLPNEIVNLLAAREKRVFLSDSEDEMAGIKPISRKKKVERSGSGPVILKEIPPPQCLQSSLEFLKKRKMQVSRSSSVLNNSNQALRFLSNSGVLSKK